MLLLILLVNYVQVEIIGLASFHFEFIFQLSSKSLSRSNSDQSYISDILNSLVSCSTLNDMKSLAISKQATKGEKLLEHFFKYVHQSL